MWYAAFRVLTDRLRIESLQPFISGAGVSRWRQVPNRSIPIRDSPGIIAAICRLVGVQSWLGFARRIAPDVENSLPPCMAASVHARVIIKDSLRGRFVLVMFSAASNRFEMSCYGRPDRHH
jgi:hypothetical protein